MSANPKRRQTIPVSSEDGLPAAPQLSFRQQWRPLRLVQRERRETDRLLRWLDDLISEYV